MLLKWIIYKLTQLQFVKNYVESVWKAHGSDVTRSSLEITTGWVLLFLKLFSLHKSTTKRKHPVTYRSAADTYTEWLYWN